MIPGFINPPDFNFIGFLKSISPLTVTLSECKSSIILSVGENDEVSIGYIGKLIAKEFEYEHMITFDETKPDGQYKKTADNSKLMKLYGNFEFTKITDGIEKSIKWFCNNYDKCRK